VSSNDRKARRDPGKRADWLTQPEQDGLHFVGYLITLDS
jgi:hypothetical protein